MPAPTPLDFYEFGFSRTNMTYYVGPAELTQSYTVPAGTKLMMVSLLSGLQDGTKGRTGPTYNGVT